VMKVMSLLPIGLAQAVLRQTHFTEIS